MVPWLSRELELKIVSFIVTLPSVIVSRHGDLKAIGLNVKLTKTNLIYLKPE